MAVIEVDSTPQIEAVLHDQIRGLLEQKAYEVENVAKRLVASGGGGKKYDGAFIYRKFGKLYVVPATSPPHVAGVPGGPPASSHGASGLLGSISHSMGEDGEGQYGRIIANKYYSYWVEMGSKLSPPHPFLRPALYAVTGNAGYGPALP